MFPKIVPQMSLCSGMHRSPFVPDTLDVKEAPGLLRDGAHQVMNKLLLQMWLSFVLQKQSVIVLQLLGLRETLQRAGFRNYPSK